MGQSFTRAKKALEAVEETRSQVGRIRRSVKMLQNRCGASTSQFGSYTAERQVPHTEKWDILADRKSLLQEKEQQLRSMETQMEHWIDLLPNPRWRMVLRYHYLDGMELSEVARELTQTTGREFTNAQVYRFHRKALEAAEQIWPLS